MTQFLRILAKIGIIMKRKWDLKIHKKSFKQRGFREQRRISWEAREQLVIPQWMAAPENIITHLAGNLFRSAKYFLFVLSHWLLMQFKGLSWLLFEQIAAVPACHKMYARCTLFMRWVTCPRFLQCYEFSPTVVLSAVAERDQGQNVLDFPVTQGELWKKQFCEITWMSLQCFVLFM